MNKKTKHKLKWFIDRVGKIVYRTQIKKHSECCNTCKMAMEYGVFIKHRGHAEYLYTVQYDLDVSYSDTKK